MRTSTLTVALVSVLLIAGAGTAGALTVTPLQAQESPTGTTDTAGGLTTSGESGGQSGPAITFNDQESSGESVLVQSATLPEDGFVVIYDSSRSGNETQQVVGASYPLSPGTSDNIRIPLDEPVNGSKSLTAVIHTDTNGNGQFDYVSSNGQQDSPLTQGDRRIVDIATVSVQGGGGGDQTDAGGATAGGENGEATEADSGTQAASGEDGASNGGTATAGGANESGGGEGGSGAFGPGFGPVIAVVALLAAALLATRRN